MSGHAPLICNVSSISNAVLLPFRMIISNLAR